MARIRIQIDNINHEIDSTNPKMLAEWMMEIFGRVPEYHPSTLIRVDIQPSYIYDERAPERFVTDWWTNTAYWRTYEPRKPADLFRQIEMHMKELGELPS